MISNVTGIDMRNLYLVYASKFLDDKVTIGDYMFGDYAYIQSLVRLRGGGSRKSKNKSYDSNGEEVRELSDPDISGTATHLPRLTYSSRYKRVRRTDILSLRSIPTQTEFMPVSYYVEPVAVANFTASPSGVSSSTVK